MDLLDSLFLDVCNGAESLVCDHHPELWVSLTSEIGWLRSPWRILSSLRVDYLIRGYWD